MDDTKIVFCSSKKLGLHSELQAFHNASNEIFIKIEMENDSAFITLNRETAIRLVKNLKREIAKIELGEEVDNG
jgi:hypothetical protein